MVDFDETHCSPLPVELFRTPKEIGIMSSLLADFVETPR